MASAAWQVGLGLAAAGAAIYPSYKYDQSHPTIGQKRKYPYDEGVDLSFDSKRQRLSKMAFRRRRTFRRRPRRFRRRRIRIRRKRFVRRVRRIARLVNEPQKYIPGDTTMFVSEANVGGPIAYVMAPASALIQGDADANFAGNSFFLRGIRFFGKVGLDTTTPPTTGFVMRVMAIESREQGQGLHVINNFTSTTTSITNPTQTPPDVNPRFFEITPFTGKGNIWPVDTSLVRLRRTWHIVVNPGDVEAGEASLPVPFNIYWRINKLIQVENTGQGAITTGQRRFKYRQYYFVIQIMGSVAGTNTDIIGQMNFNTAVHWREA